MGNCQTSEVSTVVIQHPGDKIERICWSVTAKEIMNSNPGHYVAMVMTSLTLKNDNGSPLKQLKLLRPDDSLLLGNVYRLVSFEDVLKQFATKKCVKLGKLNENRGERGSPKPDPNNPRSENSNPVSEVEYDDGVEGSNGNKYVGRHHVSSSGGGQWKPALQSIAEIGN